MDKWAQEKLETPGTKQIRRLRKRIIEKNEHKPCAIMGGRQKKKRNATWEQEFVPPSKKGDPRGGGGGRGPGRHKPSF